MVGWDAALFFAEVRKTWHFLAIEEGFGKEHFQWAHPHLPFAILRDVNDHRFQGLGMGGGADDSVGVAFEVAVAAGF